jgi:hypothetical protein
LTVINGVTIAIEQVKNDFARLGEGINIVKEKGIFALGEAFKTLSTKSKESADKQKTDIDQIKNSWESTTEQIKELWTSANESILTTSAETNAQLIEGSTSLSDHIKTTEEELLQLRQFLREEENMQIEAILAEREALIKKFASQEEAITKASSAKVRAIKAAEAAKTLEQITSFTQQGFDVAGQFIENSIIREQQASDKKLQTLEKQFKDGLISETEYEQQKEQLEKDARRKSAEAQRKAAIAEKTAALFSIAANTAIGVAKAVAALPYTGGLPISAIVTALGIAQAAAVASKPLPQVPSFQTGVTNFSGGLARINETGGELINLPGGANVLTNSASKDLLFNQPNQSNVSNVTNETTNNTTNNFNIDSVRDINDLRNELLRIEGSEAFI